MSVPTWIRVTIGCHLLVGVTIIAQAQSNRSSEPTAVENAVEARLAEIQQAAQDLNPDKVFSYVLANDKGALVEDGMFYHFAGHPTTW